MLYLRWLETSRCFAALPALVEGGRVITFSDLAAAVAEAAPAHGPVIARTGTVAFFVEVLRAWRDGQAVIPVERDAPEPLLHCLPPEGICLVKYTPGAAGVARGIFFTEEQVMADGDRLVEAMRLDPGTPNLGVISLAHSYGFSNVVLPLILHGVPVHLAPVPFPRVIEEIFQQNRSLVVAAVPSMWRAWHRGGILRDAPIALALSAGAPLSLALESEVFAACGLKIRNFYGSSECGGISLDLSDVPRVLASDVGTALPGVSVQVGDQGRLWISGSSVAMGYDSPREDDVLGGGGYLTRDCGFIDPLGRIHLTGTLGGAINVAGRKVSPAKVEAALCATGLVARVRVYAVPSNDAERFEEIAAEIVLHVGGTLEALKAAACDKLQNWELPRHWMLGD
jgi:acyl-coenzyme A synthetase/AMP-(fatty) acid ligase